MLRCVPQKTAGVVIIAFFLFSLFIPIIEDRSKSRPFVLALLLANMIILLWLGGAPLEYPYTIAALVHTSLHFLIIGLIFLYVIYSLKASLVGFFGF